MPALVKVFGEFWVNPRHVAAVEVVHVRSGVDPTWRACVRMAAPPMSEPILGPDQADEEDAIADADEVAELINAAAQFMDDQPSGRVVTIEAAPGAVDPQEVVRAIRHR